MTIWNGPMADFYYAQQRALGLVDMMPSRCMSLDGRAHQIDQARSRNLMHVFRKDFCMSVGSAT